MCAGAIESDGGTKNNGRPLLAAPASPPQCPMAHLAAAWPDQVLCKENKRRAIQEQQRKWMEQREQALSAAASSAPADDLENAAPAAVASNNKRNIAAAPAATDEIADELESLVEMNDFLSSVGQSRSGES